MCLTCAPVAASILKSPKSVEVSSAAAASHSASRVGASGELDAVRRQHGAGGRLHGRIVGLGARELAIGVDERVLVGPELRLRAPPGEPLRDPVDAFRRRRPRTRSPARRRRSSRSPAADAIADRASFTIATSSSKRPALNRSQLAGTSSNERPSPVRFSPSPARRAAPARPHRRPPVGRIARGRGPPTAARLVARAPLLRTNGTA